jgi:RHS repeat-associated protein
MRKSERKPRKEAPDPSGRLIDRAVADGTHGAAGKRYYADGLSPILVKRWDPSLNSGAGAWKTVRTAAHLPGVIGHVAAEREPSARNSNGTVNTAASFTDRYNHYDPLGNTVLETGNSAAVLARTDRSAYGEMVREANSAGTWSSQASNADGGVFDPVLGAANRPRQTTKETDPDTGLRWFGARWYDPAMGSWISPEPLGLDGPNMYNANDAKPASYYDPNGLSYVDCIRGCEQENEKCKATVWSHFGYITAACAGFWPWFPLESARCASAASYTLGVRLVACRIDLGLCMLSCNRPPPPKRQPKPRPPESTPCPKNGPGPSPQPSPTPRGPWIPEE